MTLSTNDVRLLLLRAKGGNDAKAAKELITHFRDMLSDGGSFDRNILDEYLLHAFDLIVNEETTADQAFGLKPRKGLHKREDNTARNVQIAAYIEYLVRYKSTKWADAIGEAANYFCGPDTGDRLVKDAHAKYKSSLSYADERFLVDILPEDLVRS